MDEIDTIGAGIRSLGANIAQLGPSKRTPRQLASGVHEYCSEAGFSKADEAKITMLLTRFSHAHDLNDTLWLWRADGEWFCGNDVSTVFPRDGHPDAGDFIYIHVQPKKWCDFFDELSSILDEAGTPGSQLQLENYMIVWGEKTNSPLGEDRIRQYIHDHWYDIESGYWQCRHDFTGAGLGDQ